MKEDRNNQYDESNNSSELMDTRSNIKKPQSAVNYSKGEPWIRFLLLIFLLAGCFAYMVMLGTNNIVWSKTHFLKSPEPPLKADNTSKSLLPSKPSQNQIAENELAIIRAYEYEAAGKLLEAIKQVDYLSLSIASKKAPFTNSLGMRFVPVPSLNLKKRLLFSVWETRHRDYMIYLEEKSMPESGLNDERNLHASIESEENHPVVNVSWTEANDFCKWLTDKEIKHGILPQGTYYRLPTDHEWSTAVGIGDLEDSTAKPKHKSGKLTNIFPWGQNYPPKTKIGNYADLSAQKQFRDWTIIPAYDDGVATTAPVGQYPANALGLHDLGGNVWEWCLDSYDTNDDKRKVLRGSAWDFSFKHTLASSFRGSANLHSRDEFTGFRIVLVTNPS